jgi:septal ring factor EnvC (AmiA/AmiB activator)
MTSSKRFKDGIKPMERTSEALYALKPVTFRYKKEIDPKGTSQFGLVAEEVEKVNPDLIVRDKEGKPYSVRYEQVNAMLLNEFLKEHNKVEEQQASIAELKSLVTRQQKQFRTAIADQRKEMERVVARLGEQDSIMQRVSSRIESNKTAPELAAK